MKNRYAVMTRPSSVTLPLMRRTRPTSHNSPRSTTASTRSLDTAEVNEDDFKQTGGEYAKFIRDIIERTEGPTGYLDSTKYTHHYNVKGLTAAAQKQQNFKQEKEPTTVVGLTNKIAQDQKEFEKKMQIIEGHMWQHKQEERELKRVEGDVRKKKRQVQRTLREFENSMGKKMLDEEKRLNESIQQMEKVRTEGTHVKEERTKSRIAKAKSDSDTTKAKMRKAKLITGDLQRQYRMKVTELEMRKDQIQRLTREFEDKLKKKENETSSLAKELAELAITMNMESMKGRGMDEEFKRQERQQAYRYINEDKQLSSDVDKKMSRSDGIYRASENRRRQASATLNSTRAHLSERGREDDRRVTDNRNAVESNIAAQKKLQEAGKAADLDKRRKSYQRGVQAHVLRKNQLLRKGQVVRMQSAKERSANWQQTFDQNTRDFKRRRNEDLLRTFTRVTTHDNETEYQLHQKVRELEHERKSNEQQTRKMEGQLVKQRVRETNKVKDVSIEADRKDRDLERKIVRSKAELMNIQNKRSTAEWTLRKFRGVSKETGYVYDELQRENKRLLRVAQNTNDQYIDQAMAVM